MLKNWEKNGKNYQKYAKIRDVKILQDIPFNLEIIQYFQTLEEFPGFLRLKKSKKLEKFFKKT